MLYQNHCSWYLSLATILLVILGLSLDLQLIHYNVVNFNYDTQCMKACALSILLNPDRGMVRSS